MKRMYLRDRMSLEQLHEKLEVAIESLKKLTDKVATTKKQNQWAASTFNENFITTLVTLSQKKKVQKKTLPDAI